jgi:hypothetical protein
MHDDEEVNQLLEELDNEVLVRVNMELLKVHDREAELSDASKEPGHSAYPVLNVLSQSFMEAIVEGIMENIQGTGELDVQELAQFCGDQMYSYTLTLYKLGKEQFDMLEVECEADHDDE